MMFFSRNLYFFFFGAAHSKLIGICTIQIVQGSFLLLFYFKMDVYFLIKASLS